MDFKGISAYKGEKPYVFVSYSHGDTDRVVPWLKILQEAGYRLWLDLGIEAGTEWANNIAEHLRQCSAFLFFASNNSVKSENCLDEIAYAKSHNKPALLLYLEDNVILPVGTDMQTARFQRLYLSRQANAAAFVKSFSEAGIFDACTDAIALPRIPAKLPKNKKPAGRKFILAACAILLVLLAVVLFVIWDNGDLTEEVSSTNPSRQTQDSTATQSTQRPTAIQDTTAPTQETTTPPMPEETIREVPATETQGEVVYTYREAGTGDEYNALYTNPGGDIVITGIEQAASDGVYEIPEYIDGQKVIAIMQNAFSQSGATVVYVPATVKMIWENAFAGCALTDIYLRGDAIHMANIPDGVAIHCSAECSDRDFRYFKNYPDLFEGITWEEWNG